MAHRAIGVLLAGGVMAASFSAGAVRTNNSIVRLSSGGSLTHSPFVAGGGQVHVVIDVNGWFE